MTREPILYLCGVLFGCRFAVVQETQVYWANQRTPIIYEMVCMQLAHAELAEHVHMQGSSQTEEAEDINCDGGRGGDLPAQVDQDMLSMLSPSLQRSCRVMYEATDSMFNVATALALLCCCMHGD